MDLKKQFGQRLKELRKINKLSQEKLAEKVSVDPKHISFLENGKSFPSADLLARLAESLDIEVFEFFKFEHIQERKILIKKLNLLLEQMDNNKLKFVYKMAFELEK